MDEYIKEIEEIASKCSCSQSDGYAQIMRMCEALKEEQGLLLQLPCKVGDYAWDLITRYRFEVVSIEIRSCECIIFRCGNKGTEDYASFTLDDIGETWMLTEPKETDYWNPNKKSDAEQTLAESQCK